MQMIITKLVDYYYYYYYYRRYPLFNYYNKGKQMRFSKLSLAIATTLVTANVLAQSTELDSINVIATRDPSRFAYTPQKQSKDSLLSKQATSVAAALEDIPNVDIRGGSRSIAQNLISEG